MTGVIELEAHEQLEDFQRVLSAINEVAHEYIVGLRYFASLSEQLQ